MAESPRSTGHLANGETDFSSMSYKNVVLLILKGPWVHHTGMNQSQRMHNQHRFIKRDDRTHFPDDREGATLLGIALIAATLTLLTTPVLAGLVAMLPHTIILTASRTG
jgi:hypothetical protein